MVDMMSQNFHRQLTNVELTQARPNLRSSYVYRFNPKLSQLYA